MITGANSGIGKAAAMDLARMGAEVVMVSRNSRKAEAARSEMIQATGAKKDEVSVMIADMASMDSVRILVKDFLARVGPSMSWSTMLASSSGVGL
jgi:NAD(P)-dependent dehydrogenase (short-subunit alcohol dehydrogenase family)